MSNSSNLSWLCFPWWDRPEHPAGSQISARPGVPPKFKPPSEDWPQLPTLTARPSIEPKLPNSYLCPPPRPRIPGFFSSSPSLLLLNSRLRLRLFRHGPVAVTPAAQLAFDREERELDSGAEQKHQSNALGGDKTTTDQGDRDQGKSTTIPSWTASPTPPGLNSR